MTTIAAALAAVRPAVSNRNLVSAFNSYLVRGGTVAACNGVMSAGAPWPYTDHDYLVLAEELDAVVERIGEDAAITVEPDSITVRAGRRRGRIKTLPTDDLDFMQPAATLLQQHWPSGMLAALKAVRPYVSDNATRPWAACICLRGGFLYATNNVVVARTNERIPFMLPGDVLLPHWAVDYVLAQPCEPNGLAIADNYVAFSWPNEDNSNRWMRTQLVEGGYPQEVDKILESAVQPTWVVPDAWREAALRLCEFSGDGTVRLGADAMFAMRGASMLTDDLGTPVPPNLPQDRAHTCWEAKYLKLVATVATHWAPDAWPKPAKFVAPAVHGVIVGRTEGLTE